MSMEVDSEIYHCCMVHEVGFPGLVGSGEGYESKELLLRDLRDAISQNEENEVPTYIVQDSVIAETLVVDPAGGTQDKW